MLALLAELKGKRIEQKQHRFNVNSKVVCMTFQLKSQAMHKQNPKNAQVSKADGLQQVQHEEQYV